MNIGMFKKKLNGLKNFLMGRLLGWPGRMCENVRLKCGHTNNMFYAKNKLNK